MKKRILLVFWFRNFLHYFREMLDRLKTREDIELFLISENEEMIADFKTRYSPCQAWPGYDPAVLDRVKPHVIICLNELWLPRVIPLFKEARARNIPIVTYDHGTHYCKSYYLLQQDEYINRYRGDTALCSHIVCWGQHGKENWATFGVPEEKMLVTGGLQYDTLYRSTLAREDIYNKLGIPPDKKLILLFTCLMHRDADEPSRLGTIQTINQLEDYISRHNEYVLVVKPHPIEFTLSSTCSYPYTCGPVIISNPLEQHWDGAIEIEVNQVIAHAAAVVSTHSSVLVAPLILNIPIIYIDVDIPKSKDFLSFGQNVFIPLGGNEHIGAVLDNLSGIYTEERKKESARLAAQLNFNNDGQAAKRFEALLDKIFQDQESGAHFYIPMEDEYLKNQKQFPGLPYPYQNLILWYGSQGNYEKALEWYDIYSETFLHPRKIFETLWSTFFQSKRESHEIRGFIDKSADKNLFTLAQIYRAALMQERVDCLENAEFLLNRILAAGPEQVLLKKCLYELGVLSSKKNNFTSAVQFYQQALEIITHDTEFDSFRLYYRLGEAYFNTNRAGEAQTYLKDCLTAYPEHRGARELLNAMEQVGTPGQEQKL